MKNELSSLTNKKESESFSNKDIEKLKALKNNLSDYNLFIKKYYKKNIRIRANDI